MESISKIFEFVVKYAWAVFVMAAFVLLVPDDAAKQLGLETIKSSYKGYFWLALIFTGTLSVGAVVSYFDKKIIDGWLQERRAEKKRNAKKLERLNMNLPRFNGHTEELGYNK